MRISEWMAESGVKFGLALLRPDGGGAELGVVSALSLLGVKIGACFGVDKSAATALLAAAGADPERMSASLDAASSSGMLGLLFRRRQKARREIIKELERLRVKKLSDASVPVYMMLSDRDETATLLTSERSFIAGPRVRKRELSAVSAIDLVLQNGKKTSPKAAFFRTALFSSDINAVISVSGPELPSGVTDYGYNISLRKSASFESAFDGVMKMSDEILTTIFLKKRDK